LEQGRKLFGANKQGFLKNLKQGTKGFLKNFGLEQAKKFEDFGSKEFKNLEQTSNDSWNFWNERKRKEGSLGELKTSKQAKSPKP